MNYSVIIYVIGLQLQFTAGFMMIPELVGNIYHEKNALYFLVVAAACLLIGTLLRLKKPKDRKMHAKEGMIIVALGWIVLSLVGAFPFFLSGEIPDYTDAVFETASGFTTTGASILKNVEALSHCMLFWRSFTHWLGGMGVLVFILAITPSGADSMYLMKAESPGPSVDKLVPRVRTTAFYLYAIYFAMTAAEVIILICGKMSIFDAFCLSFGTAGTGGFSTKASGIADYNVFCQTVITVFMMLFGVNFKVYFLLVCRKFKDALKAEEVKWYLGIYAAAVTIITLSIINSVGSFGKSLSQASFQAASIMTTTGYATADFNLWGTLPQAILVMLMFIGACAGSTGGGMKVSRVMIYFKQVKNEVSYLIHPRSVKRVTIDKKALDDTTLRTASAFIAAYFLIFGASFIAVCVDGFDFTSSFTSVAATINNIGPGLGTVGPYGGYADFSAPSKWVFIFDMITGRLEIFPMLILFTPSTWRRK
ncbi:MAG: TrkH family potassium uptake protein [Eubacterium sp.]|nr:TrkH family potassium uptake protein [Eubacterium sp.]